MPGPARVYASAAEKQKVYRRRKAFAASDTARLIALQEAAAHEHVVVCGKLLQLQKAATAKQLEQQAEHRERDMMDVLWMLQTLIADYGYAAVYEGVLRHALQPSGDVIRWPGSQWGMEGMQAGAAAV